MLANPRKTLSAHRQRLKRRGIVRLEVQVHREDAPLIRNIVEVLADPERGSEIRTLFREQFGAKPAVGLKALLTAAPLEGVDLKRPRDTGRRIDL